MQRNSVVSNFNWFFTIMALSEAALKKICRAENITEMTVEMTVTQIVKGMLEKRVINMEMQGRATAINI